jgi:ClpX C4-type zinc finger
VRKLIAGPIVFICAECVVKISRQVVEGAAGPLYMYAARAGGAKAT